MKSQVVAAVVQMNAGLDKAANLATAERLVRDAARRGAELVVLPELFNAYGPLPQVADQAENLPGPTTGLLQTLARELGVCLCGSLGERGESTAQAYNTCVLVNSEGELVSRYRKMHLFDIDLAGRVSSRESAVMSPGTNVVVTTTALGNIGHAICYDLRFPELFRALSQQGAELLVVPAAFTSTTGRDHWETLLRARAIENQCYVLAANQYGPHGANMHSYGGSLIIDPWGDVLAQGSLDTEAVLIAELTAARLEAVRAQLPALRHRRL